MAVRQISTELALSGEKEFNSAMKSVNNNLRTLKSDMAATSAEFDDNSNSVTALTAKNKILQDTYDQQKEKQAALAAMLKKVEEAYGADSAQADKYRQQLNQTAVAVKKQRTRLKRTLQSFQSTRPCWVKFRMLLIPRKRKFPILLKTI